MTTGPILGTSQSIQKVYDGARKVGFNVPDDFKYDPLTTTLCPSHLKVPRLCLQIHRPSFYHGSIEGVVTEIEFDDTSDRLPNNPEALEVLKRLYEEIPDLIYLPEDWCTNKSKTRPKLSEYFDLLK